MKQKIRVVIGANYGDEGKGLATRYFTLKAINQGEKCSNVLFNGGSQRGHTVEMKNGERHVFRHFGSGSLDGASTTCSCNFMVNPMQFVKELSEIEISDNIYIDPLCRVVTPYDIFLNRSIERNRSKKHGSCGCGIWETKMRYDNSKYNKLFYQMSRMSDKEIYSYLVDIVLDYIPQRMDFGINSNPSIINDYNIFCSDGFLNHYIEDFRMMVRKVNRSYKKPNINDTLVFEGGQGLALDQDNVDAYPHVTASNTGAAQIAKGLYGINTDLEVCYVTRSYFTRHGEGKLPTEFDSKIICPNMKDETNVYNEFQGQIRYGGFDFNEFLGRVNKDFEGVLHYIPDAKKSVMVTHTNYLLNPIEFLDQISKSFDRVYVSDTKYAEDVYIYQK